MATELHSGSLDDCISAFEAAQASSQGVDLRDFVPAVEHPARLTILCELIRVDMEYGWGRNQPRMLDSYLEEFPDLRTNGECLEAIAFEEYRQRLQTGDNVTPADYAQRYGIITAGWPQPTSTPAARHAPSTGLAARSRLEQTPIPTPHHPQPLFFEPDANRLAPTHLLHGPGENQMGAAAVAYRAFRERFQPEDNAALESWRESYSGDPLHASLFHDLHRANPEDALRLAEATAELPEAGTTFLGFQLVRVLGRGAFGRVYLARQSILADRFVALKVSCNLWHESQTLALLQHTNIVPIYSVHRTGPFQAVCMPYFGSVTLADVLSEVVGGETLPDSGKSFVNNLAARLDSPARHTDGGEAAQTMVEVATDKRESVALPAYSPRARETLRMLERLTWVETVLWMGIRLADGLAHAHERGVLHRDLKPANILITEDGQPMLLDFNLATRLESNAEATVAQVGGTLPYMAPEQLEAFGGKATVDARGDIYSLGVLLFQMLCGKHPFPLHDGSIFSILPRMVEDRRSGPPELQQLNPAVTPALAAIMQRCLHPDPRQRYARAMELREDLECQLRHLPLRHTPEPSWRERLQKWRKRHPEVSTTGVVATLATLILLVLALALVRYQDRHRRAEELDQARKAAGELTQQARLAQALLSAAPDQREHLEKGRDAALAILDRYQLLELPAWQAGPLIHPLPPGERDEVVRQIASVGSLLQRVDPRLPEALSNSLASLTNASSRASLQARDLLKERRFREALQLLEQATREEPGNFWHWYLMASCADRLQNTAMAEAYYHICVAMWPDEYVPWFRRGIMALRNKDYQHAVSDFSRVIDMNPRVRSDWLDAHLNRALAFQGLTRYDEALRDLTFALEEGGPTRLYFMRSRLRDRMGDRNGARKDFEAGLRHVPGDELSWVARGSARLRTDPKAALADFEEALRLNPRSAVALQNKGHVLAEKLGRVSEALAVMDQLLAIDSTEAMAFGGRGVLHARLGHRDLALKDGQEALSRDSSALRAYQVACIYALTSRQEPKDAREALRLLVLALRSDYGWDLVDKDPDLDPLRELPEYRQMLDALRALQRLNAQPSAHGA